MFCKIQIDCGTELIFWQLNDNYSIHSGFAPVVSLALLLTTYNRPDALDRVLESVFRQSRLSDEVIVADDGSDSSTVLVIKKWQGKLPLSHTWLPDAGFRAARSRNLSILKIRSEYLVMVDGDCILPPTFLEQHLALAKRGVMVAGGRYLLDRDETRELLSKPAESISVSFDSPKFWSIPMGFLRDLGGQNWKKVRTCNLGVWRSDLIRVGGFNEDYLGWGLEDSDLVIRLLNQGLSIRSARFSACVAHLEHPQQEREALSKNNDRFVKVLKQQSLKNEQTRSVLRDQ